ncbi:MAG: WG repeat-containing protein [Bacteroidales bacterium]|jgi:hypothetical protein|nr:WG repeat-containing protein [Bacteroidales bacterium]
MRYKTKFLTIIVGIIIAVSVFSNNVQAQTNKFSLKNTPFYWKIDIEYEEISSLDGNFFAIKKDNLWGVANENRVILPCKYEAIDALGDNMISFVDKGLIGFADTNGKVLIEAKYSVNNPDNIVDDFQLNIFSFGSCVVFDRFNNEYILINEKGERLLGDSIVITCRSGNVIVFKKGEKFGMCNAKGEEIYSPDNIKISMVSPVLFSYTVRQLNGDLTYGLLNAKGEVLTEAHFVEFQSFARGNRFYIKAFLKNGLQALFDNEGKMIVDALYQVIEPTILEGYFKVTHDLYTGIIGKKDTVYLMYLEPIYKDVKITVNSTDTFFIAKNGSITTVFTNSMNTLYEGQYNILDIVRTQRGYRLIVEKEFHYGVIDDKGNTIIEPEYHEVYSVIGQWLLVRLKDKWGAVNMVTQQKIEPDFKRVKISDNKSYGVFVGNKKKSLIVKPEGEIVEFHSCDDVLALNNYVEYNIKKKKERLYLNGNKIPAQFLVIGSANDGIIPVEDKNGWTFVDDKTYLTKTDKYFKYATSFFDGFSIVVDDNKIVVIDKNFNSVGTILESKDKISSLLIPTAGLISLSYYANRPYIVIRNSGKQGILGIRKK